ncbi:DNA polymerase III subunit gamma/tau [Microbacterium rhizophilus]|uniref:DNA polymerase III subunit gamma/tau n=1 Tax=Microbacterium rhizophilus TaxID=3138934 RepID=UPI0031E7C157
MSSRDDDALSWDGDEDPRNPAPGLREKAGSLPRGWRAVGRGSGEVSSDDGPPGDPAGTTESSAPAPMGNVALVSMGVLAGVYTLYVVGWALGGFRLRDRIQADTGAVADVMFQAALWLAMLSPVIWFLVTMHVTRRAAPWRRFAGLAIGIVLLVPWPFVMMGVLGR